MNGAGPLVVDGNDFLIPKVGQDLFAGGYRGDDGVRVKNIVVHAPEADHGLDTHLLAESQDGICKGQPAKARFGCFENNQVSSCHGFFHDVKYAARQGQILQETLLNFRHRPVFVKPIEKIRADSPKTLAFQLLHKVIYHPP